MASSSRDWIRRALRDVTPFMGLGIQFALVVLIGVGAGYWLERRFDLAPWGVLIGGIVGIAAGFYHFIRAVLRYTGDQDVRKRARRKTGSP